MTWIWPRADASKKKKNKTFALQVHTRSENIWTWKIWEICCTMVFKWNWGEKGRNLRESIFSHHFNCDYYYEAEIHNLSKSIRITIVKRGWCQLHIYSTDRFRTINFYLLKSFLRSKHNDLFLSSSHKQSNLLPTFLVHQKIAESRHWPRDNRKIMSI